MTKTVEVKFREPSGNICNVNATVGESLMEAARSEGVEGIDAICGGEASCGSCQISAADQLQSLFGVAGDAEKDMLEFAGADEEGCRLSCQIKVTEDFDGIEVQVVGH